MVSAVFSKICVWKYVSVYCLLEEWLHITELKYFLSLDSKGKNKEKEKRQMGESGPLNWKLMEMNSYGMLSTTSNNLFSKAEREKTNQKFLGTISYLKFTHIGLLFR